MRSVGLMIDDIIRREGGYVDHPADRGGPTKYGVTLYILSKFLRRTVTPIELECLSKDTAMVIYRTLYYYEPRINILPQEIQPFVFDSAVNHGAPRAILFVQQVCNEQDPRTNLVPDCICGPRTAAAAKEAVVRDEVGFMRALCDKRRDLYLWIVESDPSQEVFLKGWLNRLREFEPCME